MFFNSTIKVSVDSKDWIALLNKNTGYCVLKPREMYPSTDIHSTGKKTMFKKFVMLLTPFALASFGSLLTDSAVHAATWTNWQKCSFTTGFFEDYTMWRALIDVRSDLAARAIRVEYGLSNSERISTLKLQESRIINGAIQLLTPSVTLSTFNRTSGAWWLPSAVPWVSNLYKPRYVNVTLTRADGGNRVCASKVPF